MGSWRVVGGVALMAAYDVVIRRGTLFDGSGSTPFVGDLGIQGDLLAAVAPSLDGVRGTLEKDQVENYLHEQICSGRMTLFDAQRAIATDWIEVYRQLRQPVLPTVASTTAPIPQPQPVPATGGVQIASVSGAAPGGRASVTARTTAGAACAIVYRTPAGTNSTAQGLNGKTADANGSVAWTWSIGPSTRSGTGSVVVTCGGTSDSTPIQIG